MISPRPRWHLMEAATWELSAQLAGSSTSLRNPSTPEMAAQSTDPTDTLSQWFPEVSQSWAGAFKFPLSQKALFGFVFVRLCFFTSRQGRQGSLDSFLAFSPLSEDHSLTCRPLPTKKPRQPPSSFPYLLLFHPGNLHCAYQRNPSHGSLLSSLLDSWFVLKSTFPLLPSFQKHLPPHHLQSRMLLLILSGQNGKRWYTNSFWVPFFSLWQNI